MKLVEDDSLIIMVSDDVELFRKMTVHQLK